MKSTLTQPCAECPFRRTSLPGYLGTDTAEHFLTTTLADHEMPCHMTVDYEDPCWKQAMQESGQQCAGAAIFFRNIAKRSRDKDRAILPADPETVFARPQEFLDHHKRDE